MNISYLLIGGNEGDRLANLRLARSLITAADCHIAKASSVYQTAAWGKTDQPPFFNQALLIETNLLPLPLLHKLLAIEEKMGRVRAEKYGARMIDIDILFFNDLTISLPELIIPHPEIPNRRFALTPLDEIAPDLIHPVLGLPISSLLAACPDQLEVERLTYE